MNLRTFIALELPESHKQDILSYLTLWSRLHKTGINWVKPENLHLTLLFIGDTHSGDIPQLSEDIFKETIKNKKFSLKPIGFELFPAKEPRLLWVKLLAEDNSIFSFAKQLTHIVKELQYTPDAKALKLHITVGRIKTPQPVWLEQEFMQAQLSLDFAKYDTVTLYQSILKQDGPVYVPLEQFSIL
jgi:2'-5' RNA ligase